MATPGTEYNRQAEQTEQAEQTAALADLRMKSKIKTFSKIDITFFIISLFTFHLFFFVFITFHSLSYVSTCE